MCGGEERIIPIWIRNLDDTGRSFDFRIKEGPDWAILSANKFVLPSQREGVIFVTLYPDLETEGVFGLVLESLSDAENKPKAIDLILRVNDCYSFDLDITADDKNLICACQSVEYDVGVENTGSFAENFDIILDAPDFVMISEDSLSLEAGAGKSLKLSVDPNCQNAGSHRIIVSAKLARGDVASDDSIELGVVSREECSRLDIQSKSKITTDYTGANLGIKVENKGILKTEYAIRLEGVSWAHIGQDELVLSPGQEKIINLYVNPHEDVPSGYYGVNLILESEGVEYSKIVDIHLKEKGQYLAGILWFFNYFRFYIYSFIVLLVVVLILMFLLKLLKKRMVVKSLHNLKRILFFTALAIVLGIVVALFVYLRLYGFLGTFFGIVKTVIVKYWLTMVVLFAVVIVLVLLALFIMLLIKKIKLLDKKIKKKIEKQQAKEDEKVESKEVKSEVKKTIKGKSKKKVDLNKKLVEKAYLVFLALIFLGLLMSAFVKYDLGYYMKKLFVGYVYYLAIGIVAALLLIFILHFLRRFKIGWVTPGKLAFLLVIFAVVIFALVKYFNLVIGFVSMYLYPIIAGFVILAVIITVWFLYDRFKKSKK